MSLVDDVIHSFRYIQIRDDPDARCAEDLGPVSLLEANGTLPDRPEGSRPAILDDITRLCPPTLQTDHVVMITNELVEPPEISRKRRKQKEAKPTGSDTDEESHTRSRQGLALKKRRRKPREEQKRKNSRSVYNNNANSGLNALDKILTSFILENQDIRSRVLRFEVSNAFQCEFEGAFE